MGMKEIAVITGLMTSMSMLYEEPHVRKQPIFTLRGRQRPAKPWDKIHLSKAERRGKSYEEIQQLRIQKWEQQCK